MRPLSMQFTVRCSSRNKPQLELSRPCSSSSSSSSTDILVGGIILPIDLSFDDTSWANDRGRRVDLTGYRYTAMSNPLKIEAG